MIVSSSPQSGNEQASRSHVPAITGWQLGREISRGAVTSVHAARPANSEPNAPYDYAVKCLADASQSQRREQFRTEARVGSEVKHEHLVPIFTARIHRESCFLVMPLLPGATVAGVLQRSPRLATSNAIWIARQTSEALKALHAGGWLHGDLKPANMIATADGHTTLIDLGFARRIERRSTVEGPLVGSVAYAAPELFTADPMTAAADIYSLGIALFQMLTGQLPFAATSAEELVNAHLSQPPLDVRDFDPLVPRTVAWLLRRSLAKQPLRRPTATEFRDSLAAAEIELIGRGQRAA